MKNLAGMLKQASQMQQKMEEMQAKLLRALQERTVRPVGGDRETPFDARVCQQVRRRRDLVDQHHLFNRPAVQAAARQNRPG